MKTCKAGIIIAFACMLAEGSVTYGLNIQKHNSMYLFLIPVMYFLFQILLMVPGNAPGWIRKGSALIYVIHPAVIVLLRGFAKVTGLTKLLIENTMLQYLSVCLLSLALASVIRVCMERRARHVSKRTSLD